MKKKLCFLLFAAAMVTCLGVLPAQATKIANFDVLDSYITLGESFDVKVSVYDDGFLGDLTGFGFDVDPSLSLSFFLFDSYIIGPSFDDFGLDSYISGAFDPFDPPPSNAGTNVLLATLSFTAGLTAGTDTLEIVGPWDGAFSGLYYLAGDSFQPANYPGNEDIWGSLDITINSAPVPEPATMLLLATGLAGMGVFGRKKLRK